MGRHSDVEPARVLSASDVVREIVDIFKAIEYYSTKVCSGPYYSDESEGEPTIGWRCDGCISCADYIAECNIQTVAVPPVDEGANALVPYLDKAHRGALGMDESYHCATASVYLVRVRDDHPAAVAARKQTASQCLAELERHDLKYHANEWYSREVAAIKSTGIVPVYTMSVKRSSAHY